MVFQFGPPRSPAKPQKLKVREATRYLPPKPLILSSLRQLSQNNGFSIRANQQKISSGHAYEFCIFKLFHPNKCMKLHLFISLVILVNS